MGFRLLKQIQTGRTQQVNKVDGKDFLILRNLTLEDSLPLIVII